MRYTNRRILSRCRRHARLTQMTRNSSHTFPEPFPITTILKRFFGFCLLLSEVRPAVRCIWSRDSEILEDLSRYVRTHVCSFITRNPYCISSHDYSRVNRTNEFLAGCRTVSASVSNLKSAGGKRFQSLAALAAKLRVPKVTVLVVSSCRSPRAADEDWQWL